MIATVCKLAELHNVRDALHDTVMVGIVEVSREREFVNGETVRVTRSLDLTFDGDRMYYLAVEYVRLTVLDYPYPTPTS